MLEEPIAAALGRTDRLEGLLREASAEHGRAYWENLRASSDPYTADKDPPRPGGVIILLFVIYHLLHLTTGQAHHSFVKDDAYKGYLEDRRPNSQGDPYKIAGRILQTIATVPVPTGAIGPTMACALPPSPARQRPLRVPLRLGGLGARRR